MEARALAHQRTALLLAVKADGHALQRAPVQLRGDGEIVRAAVEQDWRALQHVLAWPGAEERLLTERLLEATVSQPTFALHTAPSSMRSCRALVLAAAARDGCSLLHCAPALRRDLAQLNRDATTAHDAHHHRLKVGLAVVLEEKLRGECEQREQRRAPRQHQHQPPPDRNHPSPAYSGIAAQFASPAAVAAATTARAPIVPSRASTLAAVSQRGAELARAPAALRSDRAVVLAALASDGSALRHAATELRADRGVVLAAVASHGYALADASTALRDDAEVVLAAVASPAGRAALVCASHRLGEAGGGLRRLVERRLTVRRVFLRTFLMAVAHRRQGGGGAGGGGSSSTTTTTTTTTATASDPKPKPMSRMLRQLQDHNQAAAADPFPSAVGLFANANSMALVLAVGSMPGGGGGGGGGGRGGQPPRQPPPKQRKTCVRRGGGVRGQRKRGRNGDGAAVGGDDCLLARLGAVDFPFASLVAAYVGIARGAELAALRRAARCLGVDEALLL